MSEPVFTYDVFLSHNQADKPRVRRLAERLRAAKLRVWFDEWVIQPGDDIYLAIERGLEASRTLVLCLSPAALGSDWVGLERSTVLFRDPANAGRRFIPLLLADCKLPDTLRRYKYVDYRHAAGEDFEKLCAACCVKELESSVMETKNEDVIRPNRNNKDKVILASFSPEFVHHAPLITSVQDYYKWHEHDTDWQRGNGLLCSATYGELFTLWTRADLFVTYEAGLLRFIRRYGGETRRVFLLGKGLLVQQNAKAWPLMRALLRHHQLGFAPSTRSVLDFRELAGRIGIDCDMFGVLNGRIVYFFRFPAGGVPLMVRSSEKNVVSKTQNLITGFWRDRKTKRFNPNEWTIPQAIYKQAESDIEAITKVADL